MTQPMPTPPAPLLAQPLAAQPAFVQPGQPPPEAGEPLQIVTEDGTALAGCVYAARGPARGAVLLVPAMGVPQSYYAAFARWLASRGFHTLTFDYRGMGLSRRGSLRGLEVDIIGWGEQDAQAALRALTARAPGLPVTWIGHSLGGQIVPFVRDREAVTKVITVAAGSGYWRDNAPALRRKVWIFWWAAVPVMTPVFGYFPGRRLGMVGDLPRGVIQQWRRWCLHPDYAVGDGEPMRARFAEVTTPITSLSFTDDEMMSEANIRSLHGFYVNAPRSLLRLDPGEQGLRRIGHFGFFKQDPQEPLWAKYVTPELATKE